MLRICAALAFIMGSMSSVGVVQAGGTVECHSRNYQYDECWAGSLSKPQLIHQISNSACILNKSWGYNPRSKYIWVAEGCSGVFADVAGYHYGRGDGFDPSARMYDHRGRDIGAVVAGGVIGALVEGMAQERKAKRHTTSNYNDSGGYNGCHGVGCLVDNPDDVIDDTPQFDKEGEPNFDEQGNYQGCHGVGCLVDDPGDSE